MLKKKNNNQNNFLAIIPARKLSKRIKNKNKKKINGIKLVDYTINSALKSKFINYTVLTTDYPKEKKYKNFLNFLYVQRPKNLCKDNSKTESAILHTINYLKKKNLYFKNIVLLQPTSPLRNSKHIDESIKLFIKKKSDSLFSAYLEKLFLWSNKKKLKSYSYNYKKRSRTQNMKSFIIENGAIFIFKENKFLKFKNRLFGKIDFFIMSKKDSMDIDNYEDFSIVKKII